MNHHKMAVMLSEFVDGRLAAQEQQVVQRHLNKCARCRKMHHSFQSLHAAVDYESPSSVRPFFTQRVLNEYTTRREDKIWQIFEFIPRPLITSGLALSIILIGLFMSPLLYPPKDSFESDFALLFNGAAESSTVSDDEALAIALSADSMTLYGE